METIIDVNEVLDSYDAYELNKAIRELISTVTFRLNNMVANGLDNIAKEMSEKGIANAGSYTFQYFSH